MARHGTAEWNGSDLRHMSLVLTAYHDVVCMHGERCPTREDHAMELQDSYDTLERFLERLAMLEAEDAV